MTTIIGLIFVALIAWSWVEVLGAVGTVVVAVASVIVRRLHARAEDGRRMREVRNEEFQRWMRSR